MKLMKTLLSLFISVFFTVEAQEVLVIGNESMPWNGIVNGKPQGIFIEVMEEATRHGAPAFRYELGQPWVRAQNRILAGSDELTVIIPLSRIPARENLYQWISNVVVDDIRFMNSRTQPPILSIPEAKERRIGLVNGHAIIPALESLGITNYFTATNLDQLVKMMKLGRIDAVCEGSLAMYYNWKNNGMDPADLQEGYIVSGGSLAYIGANLNFPKDVAERIASAIDDMRRDGSYQRIIEKWKR